MRGRLAFGIFLAMLTMVIAQPATALLSVDAQNQETTSSDESDLLALHNRTRAQHGIGGLRASAELNRLALARSNEMAAAQRIWHDYGIGRKIRGDHYVGENVGTGPTASDVFSAFMNSPSHRFNVLRGVYAYVGIASVRGDDGRVYVTVLYMSPELSRASRSSDGSAPVVTPAHVARATKAAAVGREISILLQLLQMETR